MIHSKHSHSQKWSVVSASARLHYSVHRNADKTRTGFPRCHSHHMLLINSTEKSHWNVWKVKSTQTPLWPFTVRRTMTRVFYTSLPWRLCVFCSPCVQAWTINPLLSVETEGIYSHWLPVQKHGKIVSKLRFQMVLIFHHAATSPFLWSQRKCLSVRLSKHRVTQQCLSPSCCKLKVSWLQKAPNTFPCSTMESKPSAPQNRIGNLKVLDWYFILSMKRANILKMNHFLFTY